MSPQQPRFVRVTHADAVSAQQAASDAERDREADANRVLNAHAREQTLATIAPLATPQQRWRGRFRVSEQGTVRQEFSCNCGKHSHGHGEPDHPDPFASVVEPERFEAEPPAWAKAFNARAQRVVRDQADALLERVRRTRPETPPAAPVSQVTSLRAGGGRPTPTDRKRR